MLIDTKNALRLWRYLGETAGMETNEVVPTTSQNRCLTCMGTGSVGSIYGPVTCTDCDGSGRPPHRNLLTERRIRELENGFRSDDTQTGIDVTWLTFELRRSREALLKILTMTSGEVALDEAGTQQLWHLANDVLGIYEPEKLRQPLPKTL